ncbi:aldolase/citrate lyase family protein [Methylocystis sp.]|uniref:aldolase/citrate lyase family protein n=1 Tax=Methylocystis sp. TaxID=1911079 RepID=UPI003D0FB6B5
MILDPGLRDEEIAAALDCGADALLLRLGDCVENDARRDARAWACEFIGSARRKSRAPKLFIELAPLDSDLVEADLDALFGPGPDGVFLPACASAAGLQRLAVKLAVREALAGVADGATRIGAFVGGDPAGVLALPSFAGASPRLAALVFDDAGLCAALGLAGGGGAAIETARATVVLAAASARVPALAPPVRAGEEADYVARRRDGFAGAMAFSPGQIAAILAVFAAGENRQNSKSPA